MAIGLDHALETMTMPELLTLLWTVATENASPYLHSEVRPTYVCCEAGARIIASRDLKVGVNRQVVCEYKGATLTMIEDMTGVIRFSWFRTATSPNIINRELGVH